MKGRYGLTKNELLDQLATHGVTTATLASVLNVREHVVWRWMIGISSVPERYEVKMIEFFHRLNFKKL